MAIAIDDDDVTRGYRAVPHHFVGGGGAVSNKIQVIAIVDTRGIALGGSNWASVVQQLTELIDCIADVGTQHVFTKELVKHLPYR